MPTSPLGIAQFAGHEVFFLESDGHKRPRIVRVRVFDLIELIWGEHFAHHLRLR